MVSFLLEELRQINEKNGIVFGDMILEELGAWCGSAARPWRRPAAGPPPCV